MSFKTGLEFMNSSARKSREDEILEEAFNRADTIMLPLQLDCDNATFNAAAHTLSLMALDLYKRGAIEGAALGIAQ